MLDFLKNLFESSGFMPHGHCYLWNPSLVRLHLLTDFGDRFLLRLDFAHAHLLGTPSEAGRPLSWIFYALACIIAVWHTLHGVWTLWTPSIGSPAP